MEGPAAGWNGERGDARGFDVAVQSLVVGVEMLIVGAVYGFGAAVGFSFVLVLFSGIRERIESADVPKIFQGVPIALITAGLMSMAFMGFIGLV